MHGQQNIKMYHLNFELRGGTSGICNEYGRKT